MLHRGCANNLVMLWKAVLVRTELEGSRGSGAFAANAQRVLATVDPSRSRESSGLRWLQPTLVLDGWCRCFTLLTICMRTAA